MDRKDTRREKITQNRMEGFKGEERKGLKQQYE